MSTVAMAWVDPSDLDSLGILKSCYRGFFPVNCNVDAAMEAHRLAFEQFDNTRDDSDWPAARLTFRAVWVSAPRTREEAQRLFDYLNGLPMFAWHGVVSGDPEAVRESILADCARQIAWRTDA